MHISAMDWTMKKFVIFLAFFVCSSFYAFGQHLEANYPPQTYDFVKLVNNYANHISASESLKSASDDEKEMLSDVSDIVPNDLILKLLKLFSEYSSGKCARDLNYTVESLNQGPVWLLKMLDSFGKPESGILLGNLRWVGEYDECLSVDAPRSEDTGEGDFRGRYCTLQFPVYLGNKSIPISTAVCLPDSCKPNETIANNFSNIFNDFDFKNITDGDDVVGNMTLSCKPRTRKLSTGAISVISFLSLFALLAFIGSSITVYEYYAISDEKDDSESSASVDGKPTVNGDIGMVRNCSVEVLVSEPTQQAKLPAWLEKCKPFFNCFCVFTNGEKILNVANSEGQLPSLHGIRFLSMSWVILCHSYNVLLGLSLRNMMETAELVDHWYLQIILNGFFCVDSFFLLSGFLLAYLFFQQCAKSNGKIPWVYFYVHRYIRLTPVYAIMILFFTFVNPYLADGPIWPDGDYDKNCHATWWWNLLYISNFQESSDQCMGWSWYLANDMQFYVISPIFLITLWRWPKVGYSLIGIGLLATFAANFAITIVYDSSLSLGNVVAAAADAKGFMDRWGDSFNKIYTKPYTRMGPYLLGLLLAYYLYKWKQNNHKKLKLTTLAAGWALASAVTFACLFGLYHQNLTTVEIAFYNGLNHIGFAMGLSWVIFVCVIGQGDIVNSLLSWKVWIPLSRLTYCAYLVHPLVVVGYNSSLRRLLEYSQITLLLLYLGFLIMSYTAALVTTLLFESPVIRLEKFIRNKFAS